MVVEASALPHLSVMSLSPAVFGRLIEQGWSAKTANAYRAANPAYGQCSVTALVALDYLGGALAKTRVGDAWHWYNLIEGKRFDFTAGQFDRPIHYDDIPTDRRDAFTDTTPAQYKALGQALAALAGNYAGLRP